jgi:hypothetical protein
MQYRKFVFASVVVFMLVLSGCASFEKEQLARLEAMPDVSQYSNKPTVYVDYHFYSGNPDSNPTENQQAKEHLEPVIVQAIEKAGLFSEYSFDKDKASDSDYTITVNVYNHGNKGAAFASGFITGFTFGLIPGSGTDNFTVSVDAIDKQGNVLSNQVNNDAVQTWIGIWFLPMMGNTPDKAISRTIENQVVTALVGLFNDKVFQYSLLSGFSFSA